ncbi:uncharacterized protein LOC135332172 isoform X2 [Halichondria panicea]|uniref:uncharacterized protein LOC135332172 isoform X2 n=1 Tax=Halichondria panicea TaxID=6063 RepID=UPI00312BBAC6
MGSEIEEEEGLETEVPSCEYRYIEEEEGLETEVPSCEYRYEAAPIVWYYWASSLFISSSFTTSPRSPVSGAVVWSLDQPLKGKAISRKGLD